MQGNVACLPRRRYVIGAKLLKYYDTESSAQHPSRKREIRNFAMPATVSESDSGTVTYPLDVTQIFLSIWVLKIKPHSTCEVVPCFRRKTEDVRTEKSGGRPEPSSQYL